MTIKSCGHANIDNLHPVFRARLDALAADRRMSGLCVRSGGRTYAHQARLYAASKKGGNTAANPDAPITPRYDVDRGRGSWHMEQESTEYGPVGYAADLNEDALTPTQRRILPAVAAEYLLWFPIVWPQREPWHIQMIYADWTTRPPTPEDKMTPDQAKQLDAVFRAITGRGGVEDDAETIRGAVDHEIAQIQGTLGKQQTLLEQILAKLD